MSDKLTINTNIAISKTPEVVLGTLKTLAADFDGAVTSAFNVTLPQIEKIVNEDLMGDGDEWGTQADNDYVSHPSMTFSDRLNTSQFAKLAKMYASGNVTSTLVIAGVYDHVIELKASDADPQLESRTIACEAGGIDIIMGGMTADSLSVQASNGAAPTYNVDVTGNGKFDYMAAQTPALVLPDPVDQDYVGQASQSNVTFNDGTALDLGSLGRLMSFSVNGNNNLTKNDRRMGDTLRTSGDNTSGAMVRNLTRGKRSISAVVGMYIASDRRGYAAHLANTIITAFSFISKGKKIGATIHNHEVEFIFNKSVIVATPISDTNGKLTMSLEIKPLLQTGDTSPMKIRIRNGSATLG